MSARPSGLRRVFSTLVTASGAVVVIRLGSLLGAGCASQEVKQAPDASQPPCDSGVVAYGCNPIPEDQPGCNTDDGTAVLLTRLPRATRYPVDCTTYLVGARDEQGNCNNDAVCKCLVTTITPPPRDAGDDAEAPEPSPISAPAWNCTP